MSMLLHLLLLACIILKLCSSQVSALECEHFNSCESCAGQQDGGMSCRWCLSSLSCVPSKYMCHSWRTVLDDINCPVPILPTFNDSFFRFVITYYIQAANRVYSNIPVGAPMSCLLKLNNSVEIITERDVDFSFDGRSIGYIIFVNHDLRHIVVGFRSTNSLIQLLSQIFVFVSGWMRSFRHGGKLVAYYQLAFEAITNDGFDQFLQSTIDRFPFHKIIVTGHSLGGALATVFATHVAINNPSRQVSLFSMSGPRAGDVEFVKLLNRNVHESFRVVQDGDPVPDAPYRISQLIPTPHHNTFEIYYPKEMKPESFIICSQPETESCLKGSWWKSLSKHVSMFDQDFFNYNLDYCS